MATKITNIGARSAHNLDAQYQAAPLRINDDCITRLLQWSFRTERTPISYRLILPAVMIAKGVVSKVEYGFSLTSIPDRPEWYLVHADDEVNEQHLLGLLRGGADNHSITEVIHQPGLN